MMILKELWRTVRRTSEFWALVTLGLNAALKAAGSPVVLPDEGQDATLWYGLWRVVSKDAKGKPPFTP